jgi:diguanylate cyclase (GGDEF)-like protein
MADERKYTVLVVEDDPGLLGLIRDHFVRGGYDVRVVGNGWEAQRRLKESSTDVVVAELTLADSDGSNLREKFLLNPGMRDVPFVYLVDAGLSEDTVQRLRTGVDDYVMKPFDPVVLVARTQSAIERQRIYEEMVRIDPLTRVLNRRSLENEILAELERVRRYKRIAGYALIDLDDFGQFNAEQGQAVGDLLLTCLARIIGTTIRNVDIAGRYRGDHFALYLPETPASGAFVVVERVREQFRRGADAVTGLQPTFSAGIAETPRDGMTLDVLSQRGDEAVRLAKAAGKARTIIWPGETAGENPGRPEAGGVFRGRSSEGTVNETCHSNGSPGAGVEKRTERLMSPD